MSEVGEDDDATSLFDDDDDEVDTGILDPLDATGDPVSALIADSVTAGRLARAIDKRLTDTEGWSLVALLALLRVTLIVAAGGGWPDRLDAADAVADVLDRVLQAPPTADEDVEASRRAAVLVALAVVATAVERWDEPDDPFAADFERYRSRAALIASEVDAERVAHYAADLDIGFGSMLTADSVLDSASFLLTSTAVERAAEALTLDYPGLRVAAPRLLRIPTATNPYTAAMRLLTRAAHLAPIAVHAGGPMGEVYAAWRPKALVLQRGSAVGTPTAGGVHHLVVGPGAHTTTTPRSASRKWHGPLPTDLALELADAGLLTRQPADSKHSGA
ncbi:hypothetical protein [Blastococcus sp. PRF04-17]|uniref:hypothetical protein n=1 Tax=Blastococcus sp. PRF04-17 TaxID=2933797 RepID=UPI001FF1DA04|nr:hypothetical protein [Blastococcus sp. PRF04-17]UOY00279.1 hypothetical protein MVA48_14845 [Blastococcus sp. PRF04-17]